MPVKNRQILLASRPNGEPTTDNFRLVETQLPSSGPGQMLLRNIYLSLDPYMRGRMNAGKSYARPVEIGEVMQGQAVGEVVDSQLPGFAAGDVLVAPIGWQEYVLSDGKGVQKIESLPVAIWIPGTSHELDSRTTQSCMRNRAAPLGLSALTAHTCSQAAGLG